MKSFLVVLFSLFIFSVSGSLNAQISVAGTPYSFSYNMENQFPTVTMPSFDVNLLLEQDRLESAYKDIPPRFGNLFEVNLGFNNSGTWKTLDNGNKVWQLGIKSPGAFSINLIFNKFFMPPGASFYVYSSDRKMVLGAFTEQNNLPERVFSTAPVKGDYIILEYNEPAGSRIPAELQLSSVTHAYRDMFGTLITDDFGTSGSCNRNVVCPEGDPWRNQIRSAAMIIVGGTRWCSGSLINNTRNDGTPFFMSANHCGTSVSTWVFMFQYQSATCTPNVDGPLTFTISGATLLANNSASDFTLMRLSSKPPASYNVYYAGWDRRDIAPSSGSGIHHPDGDIKKISFSGVPFTNGTWSGTPANSHWFVTWTAISGGQVPITEGGSSGSPIYNQDKRFVGQLHGGASYCFAPVGSLNDLYGKFSLSWDYGTTPSTQAKYWLDSINTGAQFIDGYDPLAGPLNAFNLTNPGAGLTITTLPGSTTVNTFNWDTASSGATYKWIFGSPNATNRQITIPLFTNVLNVTSGQLDAYLAGLGVAQGGSLAGSWDTWSFRNNAPLYDSLKSANGPRTLTLTRGVPALTAFNLVTPVNNATIVTTAGDNSLISSTWSRSGVGATYKWHFASPNFSVPSNTKFRIASGNGGADTNLSLTSGYIDGLLVLLGLNQGDSITGQYRVYAYSLNDSLSSAQIYNITFKRSSTTVLCRNVVKPILDNQVTQDTVNINIPNALISKMVVRIDNVSHTYDGDLAFWLKSPANQNVRIIGRVGGGGDNFVNTVLDDAAANSISTGTAPFTGTFKPSSPMTVYNGGNPNGSWVLSIYDSAGADQGSLNAWCLVLTYSTVLGVTTTIEIPNRFYLNQNYPNPFNPSTTIKYGLPKNSIVKITMYDLLGREVGVLVNELKQAGTYDAKFDGTNMASGVYFYRIEAGAFVDTKKMLLIK
ncbi:MAG: T9SS type A sorting domain-containing protein [Ignavibacteria bacterium]|nr:T9SS type A sorting domain-containing protein [Ignavibacteria bacterium]